MTTPNFATENQTYRQLMGNGTIYQVPPFQRDYSWGEEQWEDLWQDIDAMVRPESVQSHYMGYLVLQQNGLSRTRLIIDGQQRLTTLTIFILAALRVLESEAKPETRDSDNKRLKEIRRVYVGALDTVSLQVNPKLKLNRNNDSYFQTYVLPMRKLPVRNLRASEHSIRKASDFFEKMIGDFVKSGNKSDTGLAIAELVERIADGLFFTVITVTDELDAYTVFETLNARGVKLAAPDLLKNYLFAVVSKDVSAQHNEELDDLDRRWSDILSKLGSDSLTSYLRTWWGSRHSFVRQADLFKTIKRHLSRRADVYELVRGLEDDLDIYLALSSPESGGLEETARDSADKLKMFSVRQPFSLLLAVHRLLPGDFSKLLEVVVKISFRYNVIGSQSPAEQERTYARVASQVSGGKLRDTNSVIQALRGIYLSDSAFEGFFREKTLDTGNSRNKRVVKYILGRLEDQISGKSNGPVTDMMSVEHILPESSGDNWLNFDEQERRSLVYRIGNMTPLEKSLNKKVGNEGFAKKRVSYKRSGSFITRLVGENEEWTAAKVRERQGDFARVAKTVWRVDQLHT